MSATVRIVGRDPASGQGIVVIGDQGLITSIEPCDVDGDSPYLSAGFVDLQVNGYGGNDLNAGPPDKSVLERLARRLLAAGTTSFAPTLITASEEALCGALAAIASARRQSSMLAAMIPFIHVEGPSLDTKKETWTRENAENARVREAMRDALSVQLEADTEELASAQSKKSWLVRGVITVIVLGFLAVVVSTILGKPLL